MTQVGRKNIQERNAFNKKKKVMKTGESCTQVRSVIFTLLLDAW